MDQARRGLMLFGSRSDLRMACTLKDKHGVSRGLTPEETLEFLQTIHAHMAKNTGYDFADRLLDLISDMDGELRTDNEPELDGFRTLGPATLDRVVERV